MRLLKPMSTLSWSQVQTLFNKNKFKSTNLTPYRLTNDTLRDSAEEKDADGWVKLPVSPATPLSAVLLVQDFLYIATPTLSRRSILRDETTDLQEKASIFLKGRAWPVRKTAEGIASIGLEEGRSTVWSKLGWKALAELRECQFVVINEENQSIHFFPEDIRAWSPKTEIIFIEYECRYIWTHPAIHLDLWLSERETAGWTIQWPIAEGTMEELRSAMQKINESPAGKLKDVLQKRVGRGQSIKQLVAWHLEQPVV